MIGQFGRILAYCSWASPLFNLLFIFKLKNYSSLKNVVRMRNVNFLNYCVQLMISPRRLPKDL